MASRIGMATNLLPASLVTLGGKGAEWLEKQGVPPGLIPAHLRAVWFGGKLIEQFQGFGQRLDQKQYERGVAAAPLVDEILMLPLNFISGGRAAAQGAKMGARAVAKPVAKAAVEVAEQTAKTELGWIARNLKPVNWVADKAIHGGLARVSTRAHDWTAKQANRLGFNVCFAAGTPLLLTETTSQAIQAFKGYEEYGEGCDWILTRDEFDPDGPLVRKRVLRKFERVGPVLALHVGGRIIETTWEHPFYSLERGWTAVGLLRIGELIRLRDGWMPVEGVADTGRIETVYNLQVEDHHTYFVGGDDWGFSVWAHNNNGCAGKAGSDGKKLLEDGFQEINPATKTDSIRDRTTGKAHGGEELPGLVPGEKWLDSTKGLVGLIPQEVAVQLRNQTFNNFWSFRKAFWQAVTVQ